MRNWNTYHRRFMSLEEKIQSMLDPPNERGCRLWRGFRRLGGYAHPEGYATIAIDHRQRPVSRVLWELRHGPIPEGLNVLHKCDTPPCGEETHFFLGTHADNVADMVAKGRHAKAHRTMTEVQAREALEMYRSGAFTLQAIADRYGVTIQAIWLLGKGKNWQRLHTELEQHA